jgi:hypothetical protein
MKYGDIADVMEVFGVKRVGRYSLRALATRALTVEWTARIHGIPLDEFLGILQQAVVSGAVDDEGKEEEKKCNEISTTYIRLGTCDWLIVYRCLQHRRIVPDAGIHLRRRCSQRRSGFPDGLQGVSW